MKNGDAYVYEYHGEYAIRFYRENGDCILAGNGGGLFGGALTFKTAEEAQAYINKRIAETEAKKPTISEESADFIRRNIDGEIKRGYLYNGAGDQRIKLVRETLEFYNSLKTA